MDKRKRNENYGFTVLFVAIAFALTIGTAISSAYFREDYTIKVGAISTKTLKATRDVENEVATEKLRVVAAAAVNPRTAVDAEINTEVLTSLESFFNELSGIRNSFNPIYEPETEMENITLPDTNTIELRPLTKEQLDYMVSLKSMDSAYYRDFSETIKEITESCLTTGIIDETGFSNARAFARDEIGLTDWDAIIKKAALEIISSYLKTNVFIDEAATASAREEAAAKVSPQFYLKGENIITSGDKITEEAYSALVKLGYAKKSVFENILPIIGAVVVSSLSLLIGVLYIYFYYFDLTKEKKNIVLLFTLYSGGLLLSGLLSFAPFPFLPILLICMLTSLLVDSRAAIVMCCCLVVSSAVSLNADMKFAAYFLINGILTSLIGKHTTDRSKVFTISLGIGLFSALTVCAIYFFTDGNYSSEMLNMMIYAALAGILTVVISVGSLPFWEAGFGVITGIKLLELTNPNNDVLRRMIIEAPGTYHHSLVVANLAETGAYDIGANHALARVGGYYHDIGKLKYPRYFIENQVGDSENPHDLLTPLESVQILIGHVTAGLELAESHKLPKQIKAFISEHHGQTLIKYFYYRAKTLNPDAEISESDYRYPFVKPKTRETAIVMLADTVEAAVRSMIPIEKSNQEIENRVRELIKDKLDDGQLIDSQLTINDLETLAKSFLRVFKGMYHERVIYPTAPTKELTAPQ